jgi:hypothetical protein
MYWNPRGNNEDEHITINMWNADRGQMKAISHREMAVYVHVHTSCGNGAGPWIDYGMNT